MTRENSPLKVNKDVPFGLLLLLLSSLTKQLTVLLLLLHDLGQHLTAS